MRASPLDLMLVIVDRRVASHACIVIAGPTGIVKTE
jgi:hypothetical protein